MKRAYIRLDDACEKMDIGKWNRIEDILDKYDIKPLVGIIPSCEDPAMDIYESDPYFWSEKIYAWKKK